MLDLTISHISKKYYEDTILADVHLEVGTGDKIGLIGNNGCGKTTLFRIITGEELPSSGSVQLRKGVSLGYLPQIPQQFFEYTVQEVLHLPFSKLFEIEGQMRLLERRMQELESTAGSSNHQATLHQYSQLQVQFETQGGYEIEMQIAQIVEAFKLHPLLTKDYECLSGGEKTRVAIAKLLLEKPDVLLLDEPTNHLDTQMLEWLEDFLTRYDGAVIIISHDRYFLDQTVNKIVEIAFGLGEVYHGNYSLYTLEKQARLERQMLAFKDQQKKIASIEAAIKRFRLWGQQGNNPKFFDKAKQFAKRLEEMDKLQRPDANIHNFDFTLKGQKKSSKRMVVAENIGKSFNNQQVFSQINFEIFRGEKVCLIGPNGAGKSTIVKGILGQVAMDQGDLRLAEGAKVGYLEQEVHFEDQGMSIADFTIQKAQLTMGQARNLLAHYGFKGEEVFRSIGSLSGGEKSRLTLMLFTQNTYQFMVLDEPTNHLDIQSKEKLENNLSDFDGTVLFISHDRYFINMVADRILWLNKGQLISLEGNYDDFLAQRHKYTSPPPPEKEVDSRAKSVTKTSARPNPLTLAKLEAHISNLEVQIALLEEQIDQSAADYVALSSLQPQLEATKEELNEKMEAWLLLQEA